MSRNRCWCFTINNPEGDAPYLQFDEQCVRFAVWQLERGAEGTRHLQGYMELRTAKRLGGAKQIPGMSTAHLEPRRGSQKQAIDYCKKMDSHVAGPWEHGTPARSQGRSDLLEVADCIQEGASLASVREQFPTQYICYRRGIQDLVSATNRERSKQWRDLQVSVYYGDAGSGKTRTALEEAGESYYILDQGERVWFDGYEGEENLIIDDFYGWIKYGMLLRILDGHQYRCEVKGGFTYALWRRVWITSNKHPRDWYAAGLTPALERRLHEVKEMNIDQREHQ